MGMIFDYHQLKKDSRMVFSQDGFSLIELLIAFVIVIVALAGVTSSFRNFTKHSSTSFKENEKNAAIEATFQLLKRDLNMAGFGLVAENRLAEDDQFQTVIESDFTNSYDCNNDGDSNDPISETCYDFDLDGDGALSTAGSLMYRDRLFIANGWSILQNITTNGTYDGDITESPVDYYYKVANKKEEGGYFAKLTANVSASATSLTVDTLNINVGEEVPAHIGKDIKPREAAIIYGQDASGTYFLEGFPIGNISVKTINLMGTEDITNNYQISGPSLVPSKVVPAIMWYVEQKSGDSIPWLYRNLDKVLPGVLGFQTSFGYDDEADGLEWHATVPPTAGTIDTLTVNNVNRTAILRDLRAVRIVLTIRRQSNDKSAAMLMRTYEKTVLLKN